MGMLIRRHRKGIDAARQAEVEPTIDPEPGSESLPTPPVVEGDTGVPTPTGDGPTVPTGEVPAEPVEPPTGEDAVAEGTPGGAEEVEDKTGHFDGKTVEEVKGEVPEGVESTGEVPAESSDVPSAPGRNASKAQWQEYLGLPDTDTRSRDELAESVLGPKQ
jgi:hypothetical protein